MNKSEVISKNSLTIFGDREDLYKIVERVNSINRHFDLDNIIDIPTTIDDETERRIWKQNHWGTPENTFNLTKCEQDMYEVRYAFDTILCPPYIAIAELSAIFPDCKMELTSVFESMTTVGDMKFIFENGEITSISKLDWVHDSCLTTKYNDVVNASRGE